MNVSTGQQLIENVKVSFTIQLLCDSTLKHKQVSVFALHILKLMFYLLQKNFDKHEIN